MLPSNDFMRLVMFEGDTHCVWRQSVCDALTWMFCVFTGWTQTLNVCLCIVTNRSNENPNDLTTGTTLWLGSICAPNPANLLIPEAKIINNQIKRHKMHDLMETIVTCRDAKSQLMMTRWHNCPEHPSLQLQQIQCCKLAFIFGRHGSRWCHRCVLHFSVVRCSIHVMWEFLAFTVFTSQKFSCIQKPEHTQYFESLTQNWFQWCGHFQAVPPVPHNMNTAWVWWRRLKKWKLPCSLSTYGNDSVLNMSVLWLGMQKKDKIKKSNLYKVQYL